MSTLSPEILQLAQRLQMTMSDQVLRTDIVKDVIYRASDLLAIGTQIFPPVGITDQLEGVFQWPDEMSDVEEVDEGEVGNLDSISWSKGSWSMTKYRKAFMLTDESNIRGVGTLQNQTSIRRIAEKFAKKIDEQIIDAIAGGGHADNDVVVAAGAEWDNTTSATRDIIGNVIKARGNILNNSNVTNAEIAGGLAMLVGTPYSSVLQELHLIGNVQQSIASYLGNAYRIRIFESRDTDLADDAYLVVPGPNTGQHMFLNTSKMPLVEATRVAGVGNRYMTTKFFGTYIEPFEQGATTTYRIAKIENCAV